MGAVAFRTEIGNNRRQSKCFGVLFTGLKGLCIFKSSLRVLLVFACAAVM
jgi:hypothetical protein